MTDSITLRERFHGALFGLAFGDAISFPALFHRFQDAIVPRKRHDFLWRTNMTNDRSGIAMMTLPYTHRLPAETLGPSPTDDTEFALLTLNALLAAEGAPTETTFLDYWQQTVLPHAESLKTSFSEQAALENLKRGLLPPATGNDNPLHYEDRAAVRAVPIGLYAFGDPELAAHMAEWDASITQAEDGLWAAQSMAVALAYVAAGATLRIALTEARVRFPAGSWIAHMDGVARACLQEADKAIELPRLLSQRVINTVYSYGSAAPETIPAAFVLAEAAMRESLPLEVACMLACTVAKSADSLPALVGALMGAHLGLSAVPWRDTLHTCRGVCVPFLKGTDLAAAAAALEAKARTLRGVE